MFDYFQSGGKILEYHIIRRKRKTIGISVSLKEGIRISAPGWVSKKQINEVVLQKAGWISKKLEELSQAEKRHTKREFDHGESLLFLGDWLKLNLLEEPDMKKIKTGYSGDGIQVTLPSGLDPDERKLAVREALSGWYKKRTEEAVNERMAFFSKEMGVKPARITVKQQKKRWGSCSSKRNININWRLSMLPMRLIDYIIVHELAHLRFMNHSKDFWRTVESVLPDYKNSVRLLKEYGRKLDF